MLRPLPLRVSLIALAILIVLVSRIVAARPDGTLQIMLPALGGDGALVITPDGTTVLIDGGADGAALATWLGDHLPFGQRHLDALVLTQASADTLPGQLAAIKRYTVGAAFLTATERPDQLALAWQQMLGERSTPVHILESGDQVHVGSCGIDVLTAQAGSATLALLCPNASAYFLQSIDHNAEAVLNGKTLPPADVVVYPWKRPTDNALLHRIQPDVLVFSEGGMMDVQQSFAQRRIGAAQLLHEDVHGMITVVHDGARLHVHTEHNDIP